MPFDYRKLKKTVTFIGTLLDSKPPKRESDNADERACVRLLAVQVIDEGATFSTLQLDASFENYKCQDCTADTLKYRVGSDAGFDLELSSRQRAGYCMPSVELRADLLASIIQDNPELTLRGLSDKLPVMWLGFDFWIGMAVAWLECTQSSDRNKLLTCYQASLPYAIQSLCSILPDDKVKHTVDYLTQCYKVMCERMSSHSGEGGTGIYSAIDGHGVGIDEVIPGVVLTPDEVEACHARLRQGCLYAVTQYFSVDVDMSIFILWSYRDAVCLAKLHKSDENEVIASFNKLIASIVPTNVWWKVAASVLVVAGVFAVLAGTGAPAAMLASSLMSVWLAIGIISTLAGLATGVLSARPEYRGRHPEALLLVCSLVFLAAGICTTMACTGGGVAAYVALSHLVAHASTIIALGGVSVAAGVGLGLFSTIKVGNPQAWVNANIDSSATPLAGGGASQ